MRLPNWLARLLRRIPDNVPMTVNQAVLPLREFVYLDEVSLRSLLSSQTGEMKEATSEQSAEAEQVDLSTTTGVSSGVKVELASRYQTSNSSTLQTSRKATVQSWFRDLHNLPDLRLIEPHHDVAPAHSITDLIGTDNLSILCSAAKLQRGKLVEFRVRLEADPVFRFTTLMTEFSGLADDHPVLFAQNNGFAMLGQMEPVNRILQRLLAGLIPVRARAVDYLAATIEGAEYVIHRSAIGDLDLETKPIEIVGVTEHLAYWKDIRRVLFSQGEFTMLCRMARDGLQPTWTPVKLAELFVPFAPDLIDQINFHSRSSLQLQPGTNVNLNEVRLGEALAAYRDALLSRSGKRLTATQEADINELIDELKSRGGTVTGQRSAFAVLHDAVSPIAGLQTETSADLQLREHVRESSGLSLFPSLNQGMTFVGEGTAEAQEEEEARLLDVEVVAIYW